MTKRENLEADTRGVRKPLLERPATVLAHLGANIERLRKQQGLYERIAFRAERVFSGRLWGKVVRLVRLPLSRLKQAERIRN